jgi:hypothetical protein
LLGEILLLQILKRDIGQENKLEERFVPLGEGCYIGCEVIFFMWVNSTTFLHYRREFLGVEIR